MNQQALRRTSCGALFLALWGFCSCASSPKDTLPSAPSVTLSVNSTSINTGQSVTLTWQASNATSVTITASDASATRTLTTSSQVSGTVQDSPSQTTTYTAVASGPGGSSTPQTAKVQVAPLVPPQITQFTATPT